jgi:hypothetical protein
MRIEIGTVVRALVRAEAGCFFLLFSVAAEALIGEDLQVAADLISVDLVGEILVAVAPVGIFK